MHVLLSTSTELGCCEASRCREDRTSISVAPTYTLRDNLLHLLKHTVLDDVGSHSKKLPNQSMQHSTLPHGAFNFATLANGFFCLSSSIWLSSISSSTSARNSHSFPNRHKHPLQRDSVQLPQERGKRTPITGVIVYGPWFAGYQCLIQSQNIQIFKSRASNLHTCCIDCQHS